MDRLKDEHFQLDQAGLRMILDTAPNGILMVDEKGFIVLANKELENLFRYECNELLGEPIEILVPHAAKTSHPGSRQHFFKAPEPRAMGAGRDLNGLRKDGTLFPVEIGLNPLQAGDKRYVVASVVDITERKKSEKILQENLVELKRSNEDLQQFAYVCSHDLQEPLRVITNYTQLLERRYRGQLDDNADDFIEFITDAASRMQVLINDLLVFSRVHTRGQEMRETDCNYVVKKAMDNLKLAIEENEATIVIETEPLPAVLGDSTQLTQLFQNIIGNAIKFRSEVKPIIRISTEEGQEYWTFKIRDNGIGFEMQYAARIFVIFQRLHPKETYAGSGIGLAVCKKIVERHGGVIAVESEPGEGTTIEFTLKRTRKNS
ncbi:MAG: PAS domain S-box protein [Candidatus Obscuribacterales bacterium]|nr:PAS domain S-box protein [Cyanobacteria bacterium HKST-UBA01]MCB9471459.1 PAS domain S-box protein [Candidatus Obscuribacterales bacterium]